MIGTKMFTMNILVLDYIEKFYYNFSTCCEASQI